jgi:hypothetical protein
VNEYGPQAVAWYLAAGMYGEHYGDLPPEIAIKGEDAADAWLRENDALPPDVGLDVLDDDGCYWIERLPSLEELDGDNFDDY